MDKKENKSSKKSKTPEKKHEDEKEEKREEVIEEVNDNIEKVEESEEKKEHPSKKQLLEEKRILIVFGGILLLFAAAFVAYLIVSNNAQSFVYDNVTYSVARYGQMNFYKTTIPIIINGSRTEYSLFLYNNPRTLGKEIPFNGNLYIKKVMKLNYSNDIRCNGDGVIAVANLANLYTAMGTKVITDTNATCSPQQKYVDINIKVSNKTDIEEVAPACYVINVANCQILQATERYMTKTFTTIQPYLA